MAIPTYPRWSIGIGPAAGSAPTGEVVRATSRKWARRLDRPDTFAMTINGRTDVAGTIGDLSTDIWLRRGGSLLGRTRITVPGHKLSGTKHVMTIQSADYTSLLDRRLLAAGDAALDHVAVDQAQIAWLLIQATQGRTGGALGITAGTVGFTAGAGSTGVVRERHYSPGDSVGKLITQLSAVDDGFNWLIDGDLKLQVYYPSKGSSNGVILDYGGLVTALDIAGNAGGFSNVDYVEGAQGLTPIYQATAGIGSDARGRWEDSFTYSTVKEQTTLQEKADGLLVERSRPPRVYKCRLRAGAWGGPSTLDIGDTVRVVARSGALDISPVCRVMELGVSIADGGEEEVDVVCEET
jgi:hypothetical protein